MLQDEQTLRRTVAKNIAAYRKSHKDTQLDLARKLNYSDKSVSKWERGEGLPDVYILAQIAQLYGVTVSNLIGEEEPPKKANPHFHIYVLLLSVALVFVIAAILFTAFTIAAVPFPSWLFFLYAVPVSSIVCIVFTSLWWGILMQGLSITALIWSAGACIYLSIPIPIPNLSLIFVVCAAVQVLITLGAVPLLPDKNMVLSASASPGAAEGGFLYIWQSFPARRKRQGRRRHPNLKISLDKLRVCANI